MCMYGGLWTWMQVPMDARNTLRDHCGLSKMDGGNHTWVLFKSSKYLCLLNRLPSVLCREIDAPELGCEGYGQAKGFTDGLRKADSR